MLKYAFTLFLLLPSLALGCGLHQSFGLHITSEPGSLEVFTEIIAARKAGDLTNTAKPDQFKLFSIKKAFSQAAIAAPNFTIFEAIKGHYSQVTPTNSYQITGRNTLPNDDDLVLVTELDVLDTLATGGLSWQTAKQSQLVRINGVPEQVALLDSWLTSLFDSLFQHN
ncbi:hypothetical protein BIY22_00110 [Vibrio panuliri]|uniref:DUF4136 domain-containing protein n=1 Tax=Vibrio panuliri TaxID=1381081 RepID=A0A1Q9HQ11_9VIBR|nr:hypothetical protein [Vibrio panuliri]OLQ92940.1 hypothetical protein BIY22_00110 [Vibrio panuliri]